MPDSLTQKSMEAPVSAPTNPKPEPAEVVPKPVFAKTKTLIFILLGILLVVGLLFAGVVLGQKGFLNNVLSRGKPPPTPTLTLTPAPEPTTNWQTYTNPRDNFSVKYPDNWFSRERVENSLGGAESYLSNENSKYSELSPKGIYIFLRKKGKTENDSLLFNQAKETEGAEILTVDGQLAVKNKLRTANVTGVGDQERYQIETKVFYKNKVLYEITLEGPYIKAVEENEAIYDQILSTFKFLDQTSLTQNWKTYTNTKYGFEFKYPNLSKWNVVEGQPAAANAVGFVLAQVYNYDVQKAPGRSYSPSDGDLFKIDISLERQFKTADLWFENQKQLKGPDDQSYEFFNIKPIVVDSQKGIYFETKDRFTEMMVGTAVFQTPQNEVIIFAGGLNFQSNKQYFDQILSTFKFTQ